MTSEPNGQRPPRPPVLVCEVARRGRVLVGEPVFRPGPPVTLAPAGTSGVHPGDLVVAETDGRGRGRVREWLGEAGRIEPLLHGLAWEEWPVEPFPAVELGAAGAAPERADRVDLRHLETFTIDPERARDHDDALSVEDRPERPVVWVHIADVSAFVAANSDIDREAAARTTSLYLPGRVDPMLPPALSEGACSLRPDADRLAVSLAFSPDGAVRTCRSTIRSRHRLSYAQVDRMLASGGGVGESLTTSLRVLDELADRLESTRRAAGAFEVAIGELEIEITGGRVTGAREVVAGRAHRIVEELMVAANRAVAERLAGERRPAVHRVHEHPSAASAEVLARRLAELEVPAPPMPDLHGGAETAAHLARTARSVLAYTAGSGRGRAAFPPLVVRALERARYDTRSLGHSGLAARAYCHFTSPIRRYPDLVCQRALLAAGDSQGQGLDELAAACTDAERVAERLERRGQAICLAHLLWDLLYERGPDAGFEGEVVGVIGAGAFVRFGPGAEGLLPSRAALGGRCDLDELGVALVEPRSGRRLRLGDPVEVTVGSVERTTGRVRLARP